MAHGFMDALGHLVLREVRDGAMQRRCADKRVNARLCGVLDGLPAAVDVGELRAGEAADHAVLGVLRNFADRFEVAFGSDGKPGLDNIDAHFVQQPGNFELFGVGHGRAGRLFTVTKGRVEDQNAIFVGCLCHLSIFPYLS